jgi:hypothetical protein
MSEIITCTSCKEEINELSTWASLDSGQICEACEESDLQSASTMYRIYDKVERIHFGQYVSYTQDGDESYDWFDELLKTKGSPQKWKQTDAWRGYYDSTSSFNLESLASGWTTGWVDETVQRKLDFNALAESLIEQKIVPPFPIYILIEQTSNLFSSAVDVLIESKDKGKVVEWLESEGYSVEGLKHALT